MHFDYGFEYLGSTNRDIIIPLTEKVFVMITQAVQAHKGILCMGQKVSHNHVCMIVQPLLDYETAVNDINEN